jgi:beta-xylosidase
MGKIKLAEALLRRKELQQKVDVLSKIKGTALFEVKVARIKAHEGLDDITAQVPILRVGQVTEEYDFYARQLRLVDAAIQQANWTIEVDVVDTVMADFRAKEEKKTEGRA